MATKLNTKYCGAFLKDEEIAAMQSAVSNAHKALHEASCPGKEYLGWLTLPTDYDKGEFERIKKAAQKIRSDSDVLIVIGIGGSYLGARAAIEFINSQNYNLLDKNKTKIYYAGNGISSQWLNEILELCEGKRVSVNVISKSGTTTEPAIAFRCFRALLEERYGAEEAKKRIYCTTDKERGALKLLADEQGYECFVVPDNVGGRYSVLTAVGLLPIAVSGADIDELMLGAREAQDELCSENIEENDCYKYAAVRSALYKKGYKIETLAAYEPSCLMLCEWWKQLFGESEGKDNKGLYPSSVIFSTDLHSMGQYIQQGARILFETVVNIEKPKTEYTIKACEDNSDELNYLAGKTMDYVNNKAMMATVIAHNDGEVPNLMLNVPSFSERELGYLFYFFEKACAISGLILGVNPFNQPGVEEYKRNMFALLGKSDKFSAKKAELEARLAK